jgi:chromosome segregation ATPase
MKIDELKAEIAAIVTQIESLKRERAQLPAIEVDPGEISPEALAQAYRRQARETSEIAAELKGIDDAIAALNVQLERKQGELTRYHRRHPMQERVDRARDRAIVHAERINDLAVELAEEVKALKAIADEISPSYWQVYYKPFITGFKSISVPHVRSDGEVWTIVNRVV